jgi:hypothetical protein
MDLGLIDVKVGDEVVCTGRGGTGFSKVTKVLPTQVLLENGRKVLKRTGAQVGTSSSWHTLYWRKASEEDHVLYDMKIRVGKVIAKFSNVSVTEQNVALVEDFLKALSELPTPEKL